MSFELAYKATLGVEGGDSDDKADAGGVTHDGITEEVARRFGYTGPMADMPIETVHAIYKAEYWDIHDLDAVDKLSAPIAAFVFDTAVLGGAPAQWLQRSLNVLNENEADFGNVPVTGHIGAMTIAALAKYLTKRQQLGETVLMRMLNSFRGVYLIETAETRPADERFLFGWIAKRLHFA